ncbi:PKD domain-containing protein [Anditalea andensis]|uniref:PKD domain-containing protein n=1 Tax=Anditalea andensis TaxID=1048983 RepID=UPI0013DECF56|nr:PKD domain-containing protein [Anditalea andensis]
MLLYRFFLIIFSVLFLGHTTLAQTYNLVGQNETYSTDPAINFIYTPSALINVDLSIARFVASPGNTVFYGYNAPNPIPADWVLEILPGTNYVIENQNTVRYTGNTNQNLTVNARVRNAQGNIIPNLGNIQLNYRIVGNFSASNNFNNCTGEYIISVNEHTYLNRVISRPYTVGVFANGVMLEGFPRTSDGPGSNIIILEDLPISPPNYEFVVTNGLGQEVRGTFTILEAYYPRATVTFAGYECSDSDNGKIDVLIDGATLPIQWSLTDANGVPVVTNENVDNYEAYGVSVVIPNVNAGEYVFSFTDFNGCTGSVPISIVRPAGINLELDESNPVSCFEGSDGNFTFVTRGGWTQPFEGNIFNPVNWGPSYQYELIKDGVVIPVNPLTYRGSLDNEQDSWVAYFGNLTAGSYQVRVSETVATNDQAAEFIQYSCSRTFGPFIIEEPAPLVLNEVQVDVLCHGDASGELSVSPTGGTPDYAVTWYRGNFEDTDNPTGLTDIIGGEQVTEGATGLLPNLPVGLYAVLVEDANGCLSALNFEITQPDELQFTVGQIVDVDCHGASTGAVTVALTSESVSPYTYALIAPDQADSPVRTVTTPENTWVFDGLPAGSYQVIVTDANNCTLSSEDILTIMQPNEPLAILLEEQLDIVCNGDNNGEIAISVTGGGGPENLNGYNYNWSLDDVPFIITGESVETHLKNLGPGSYQVVITDAVGCTISETFVIAEPTPLSIEGLVQLVTCFNEENGAIDLTVSGGVGDYEFTWQATENGVIPAGQQQSQSLTGLRAGHYTVTVKDGNGCDQIETFILTQPMELLLADPVPVDVQCKGEETGSIAVQIDQESVAPYTFSLIQNETELISEISGQTAYLFSGLRAGSYLVRVTDDNGCFKETTVNIQEPETGMEIQINATSPVTCFGDGDGTIDLDVVGGGGPTNTPDYTFTWTLDGQPYVLNSSSTDRSLVALMPGVYQVTIADGQGCSVTSEEFLITQPDELVAAGATSDYNGFGISRKGAADGQIILSPTGGTPIYEYSWSTEDGIIPAGMENQKDLTGLVAGTYTVTVMDSRGCVDSETFILIEPEELILEGADLTDIACFGENSGSIRVNIEAGSVPPFLYIISGTTYENTVFNVEFSTAALTHEFLNLPAGQYTATVRDANGVEEILVDLILLQPAEGMAIQETVTSITCFGENNGGISIVMSGGGGVENAPAYHYTWYRDGQLYELQEGDTPEALTNLFPGTYHVVVEDGAGCTITSVPYILAQPEELNVIGTLSDYNGFGVSCFGAEDGTITLTITGGTEGYTYQWTTEDGLLRPDQLDQKDLTDLPLGTYTVTVLDGNECSASATFILSEPDELLLDEPVTVEVLCIGEATGSIQVIIAQESVGPYRYSLLQGDAELATVQTDLSSYTFTGLEAGNYDIAVFDLNGCMKAIQSIIILEPAEGMEFTIDEPVNISCFGAADGSIRIGVQGGGGVANQPDYTFSWTLDGNAFLPNARSSDTELVDLVPGIYQVRVNDGFGCSILSREFVITQPDELRVSGAPSNYNGFGVSCFGDADGTVTLTITGGTADYSYEWTTEDGALSPAQLTQKDLTGLPAGTYTVTVVDAEGCSETAVFTLTQPDQFLLNDPVVSDANCYGQAGGSIAMSIQQASLPPFTYLLYLNGAEIRRQNTLDQAYTFEGLSTGTYTVMVADANGCVPQATEVTISGPDEVFEFTQQEKTDILCSGEVNGTITIAVSGGGGVMNQAEYTYNWFYNGQPYLVNELSTNTALSALAPGTYYVWVEDQVGCGIRSEDFIITEPSPLVVVDNISAYNGYEISCHGGNNGSISLTLTGGTGAYSFSWTTADGTIPMDQINNQNLTGLTAGTYRVVMEDANRCTQVLTYVLREPEALILQENSASRENIVCYGEATGVIETVADGGNAPYVFSITGTTYQGEPYWFSSESVYQTLYRFEALPAGTYQVDIRDANECAVDLEGEISITQPDTPLAILNEVLSDYNGFNITCSGATDGSINLQVGGGIGEYTYTWTGPNGFTANTLNLNGIGAGSYTFTLLDQNECSIVKTYTIMGPEPLEVETVQQNVLCGGQNNGNIFITQTRGGNGNYQYVWMKDGVLISRTNQSNGLRNIGPGSYTLILTDGNDCDVVKTFTITEPDPVLVQLTGKTDNVCFGERDGSIQIAVQGGTAPYTYAWTGPQGFVSNSANLQNLLAGEYNLAVTDALQCTESLAVTISEPEEITVQETLTHITCFGDNNGQISVEVSGGVGPYRYRWSGPNGFVSNARNLANLYAGEYILSLTDGINCVIERRFSIVEPGELALNPVISDYNGFEISCKGGSNGFIALEISGGTGDYEVIWEGPQGFYSEAERIEDLYPGTYDVFVRDGNDCWIRSSFTLSEPDQLVIGEENLTPKMVSCYNGRDGSMLISLPNQSVAPYTYEITGQYLNGVYHEESIETAALSHEFTELRAGVYNVSVIDANGCYITEVTGIAITQPQAALAASAETTDVQCYLANNGAVSVLPSGGTAPYTIIWNNGAASWALNNLAPGNYTAIITDANGCAVNVAATIQEGAVFEINPETADITCAGQEDGSIRLNINGGTAPVRVVWDHGPQTPDLFNLPSGVYRARITDARNCEIRQEFVINEPAPLLITSSVTHALSCEVPNSGAIEVIPSGGTAPYTFEWSNGANQARVENLSPGQYSVRVTDASGCSRLEQFTIQRAAPLEATVIQYPSKICEPRTLQTVFETVVTGGQPPYQITWNRGTQTNGGYTMVTPETGLFTLTVTDGAGCQYVETFSVEAEEDIFLDFDYRSDSYDEFYEHLTNYEIQFNNLSAGDIREFGWDFGDGNTSIARNPVHRYQRPGEYVVTLTMRDLDGCTASIQKKIRITDYFLEIPNVFTPNGDGLNDHFFPKFVHITSLDLWVLNKWGEYIYHTNSMDDQGWDGTLDNKIAPQGNYVYKIRFTTRDGREVERTGAFFLAR